MNPFGHAAKDFKFGAMYFLLGHLEPEYRSKLHVIQLAPLANAKTIKRHGFSLVLVSLLKDLKVLEDDGMEVQKMDAKYRFKGSISVVFADNLGIHGIFASARHSRADESILPCRQLRTMHCCFLH